MLRYLLAILALCTAASLASGQTVRVVDVTPLRAERAADGAAVAALAPGSTVRLLQLSGGWAQIESQTGAQPGLRGWVRASLLDLRPPEVAVVSQLETGRRADGATAVTLGVRSLPPRANRHALIVAIGRYRADAARPVEALSGIDFDISSALLMARALQVPNEQVTLLRDEGATRASIESAVGELAGRVQAGDRVFVYWTGAGSRAPGPVDAGCAASLLTTDLQDIAGDELAVWLQPLVAKVDKLMLLIDAGHAAGALDPAAPVPFGLQSKFAPAAGRCRASETARTRGMASASTGTGVGAQDLVSFTAARADEPAWQGAEGGLATVALRDCLRGDAHDDDGSGAVSAQEVVTCAQAKVERTLGGTTGTTPHIVLTGNREFVPAWFARADALSALAPVTGTAAPAPLGSVLEQIHAQRDSKRDVRVSVSPARLRIGTDALGLRITSSRAGHVYIAMLGSDGATLTLLFPNDKDRANRIEAGATLALPRAAWRLTAGGPPGDDRLLVIVSDGPRDLPALGGTKAGPFVQPLTDREGRAQLQWLLGQRARASASSAECERDACSDAFGSALLSVQEIPGPAY